MRSELHIHTCYTSNFRLSVPLHRTTIPVARHVKCNGAASSWQMVTDIHLRPICVPRPTTIFGQTTSFNMIFGLTFYQNATSSVFRVIFHATSPLLIASSSALFYTSSLLLAILLLLCTTLRRSSMKTMFLECSDVVFSILTTLIIRFYHP